MMLKTPTWTSLLGAALLMVSLSGCMQIAGPMIENKVDLKKIAEELEREIEHIDAVRYLVPEQADSKSAELPLSESGKKALEDQLNKAELDAVQSKESDLGIVSTDFVFDSYEIVKETVDSVVVDFKYISTKKSKHDNGSAPWMQEEVYALEFDLSSGNIVDVIYKDEDWVREHMGSV